MEEILRWTAKKKKKFLDGLRKIGRNSYMDSEVSEPIVNERKNIWNYSCFFLYIARAKVVINFRSNYSFPRLWVLIAICERVWLPSMVKIWQLLKGIISMYLAKWLKLKIDFYVSLILDIVQEWIQNIS